MSVKFYQFGVAVGGTDASGGTAAPETALWGEPETFEGTVGAGGVTINFSSSTKGVTITNTSDLVSLEYSLDGGSTWLELELSGSIHENVSVSSLRLQRVTTDCTYEVVGTLV